MEGDDMAENPAHIHVVGLTSDGQLWHTVRRPGGWSPWTNVYNVLNRSWQPFVTDVAAARLLNVPGTSYTEGLFVVLSFVDGRFPILVREPVAASWQEWDVATGNPALRVAAAFSARYDLQAGGATQRLQLASVTPAGAAFGVRRTIGGTQELSYALPQAGRLRSISLGYARTDLTTTGYPAAVTATRADGRAWISDAFPGTAVITPVDLETAGPGEIGDIIELARTGSRYGDDHFVAVTGDGRIWLASRLADGTWQRWRDLELRRVQYVSDGVVIVTEELADVGTFRRAAATTSSQGLHILGITTDGRLWHQLRPDPWVVFRDVELVGVGTDVGDFIAVAAA
jgi:hypothetical protein